MRRKAITTSRAKDAQESLSRSALLPVSQKQLAAARRAMALLRTGQKPRLSRP